MADFRQAVEWMREGKVVYRKDEVNLFTIEPLSYKRDVDDFVIFEDTAIKVEQAIFTIEDFTSLDWEVKK